MKRLFSLVALVLMACGGSSGVTAPPPPPPPVATGTIRFALTNCQNYQTAEYVVDSTSVGTEPIVSGALSKDYTVPAGLRSTIARVTMTGAANGLWTFRDRLTVPANGTVTATLRC